MDFNYRRPVSAPGSSGGMRPSIGGAPKPTPYPQQPRPQYASRPQVIAAPVATPPTVSRPAPVSATPAPQASQPAKKSSKKLVAILAIAGAVALVAVVAVILTVLNLNKNAQQTQTKVAAPSFESLAALPHARVIVDPATIPGYSINPTFAADNNKKGYHSADSRCELRVENGKTSELPGVDLSSAVMAVADTYKTGGATVDGPSYGDSLLLKSGDGKTYGIPTADFTVKGEQTTSHHYSLATFKDSTYALVVQSCQGNFGDSAITELEKITRQYVKIAQ